MKLKYLKSISGNVVLFLLTVPVSMASPVPAGTFQTSCHERHFWISVKSSFIGAMTRFDFEDQSGYHVLSEREATLCGYTVLLNHLGDLVFRASFLACHVHSQRGTDYHLRLWFVNHQADGNVATYPFQVHCALQWPWGTREIVCEENYMEVSIQQPVLPASSKAQKKNADAAEMVVLFHRAGTPPEEARAATRTEAAALGCHMSQGGSRRLALRCTYSSPLSYTVKEKGVDLEVVTATILCPLQGAILAIDATVVCTLNEALADGPDLVWAVPHILSPLVHGGFRDRGMRVGVGSWTLSEWDIKEKGYIIGLREGQVELRIPIGAQGGHIMSGVKEGRYSQSMSVDLFFMCQWEEQHWPLTQHRSFRLLKTPLVPKTLIITNHTVPSKGAFSLTLGVFLPDVSLQKVTVEGGGEDLNVSRLHHPNGSHSYHLSVPFSHSNIIYEYTGGGHKKYILPLTFTFTISPHGAVFYHQATVESSVQERSAPGSTWLEGKCTESGLRVLLHHDAQDELQWELFLGARRLDWELVELGGFRLEAEEEYFSVEIPLDSPGMTYEDLSLRGLVATAEVSVVDADSLKVEDQLVQTCTFPVRELLACLPEGRIVAVVDTTHTIPPTQPNRTTLLDPSCVPMETDSARALFNFSLDSCGTTVTTEGSFLVYENQVRYAQEFLPLDDPLIHRDSPYRLTIQCRYPADENSTLPIQHPFKSTQDLTAPPAKRVRREAINTGDMKWIITLDEQQKLPLGVSGVSVWILSTLSSLLLLLLFIFLCMG
ncbi:uncharacterized protein LOC115376482 isoform X2 [Myripristis murdjan]|uniref:uncharacterized protein LOC115376482 isoform X2 n=1 Tax=Myripristis murdjan TaxID=586833 RepID=UPI0011762CBD|nr:uncharacterized protein LOC115376482 isoform X2 [Myripristis murdjan]